MLHETMHVVEDISRFGVAPNFDAGIGESLLQHFAKHPGSTTKYVAQKHIYSVNKSRFLILIANSNFIFHYVIILFFTLLRV